MLKEQRKDEYDFIFQSSVTNTKRFFSMRAGGFYAGKPRMQFMFDAVVPKSEKYSIMEKMLAAVIFSGLECILKDGDKKDMLRIR